MNQPLDWRLALQEWQKDNPRTIPPDLEQIRQEFLRRFPRERLEELTLRDYALGHDDFKDSFCYWLEWETERLGSVRGGSSAKWGVWYSSEQETWRHNRAYDDAHDALDKIKRGLQELLQAAAEDRFTALDDIGDRMLGKNRNSLRSKPLYLYFPDKFLPISNPTHLANILTYFEQEPESGLHARNRQLLTFLRNQPEFEGFDSLQMGRFCYAYSLNEKRVIFKNEEALRAALRTFARFANTARYRQDEYDYKSALLAELQPTLQALIDDEEDSIGKLRDVLGQQRSSVENLTSWQDYDVFRTLLEAVPEGEARRLIQGLLDEDGDLGERIDTFREDFETTIANFTDREGTVHLGFLSLLLMGYDPEQHIIYRYSAIDKACSDWGVALATEGKHNDGEKYLEYLALVPPLQQRLTQALGRSADHIDVHSLLWFNYSPYYEDDRAELAEEDEKPTEQHPFLQRLQQITERTRNVILYGPPGTGKTYWVRRFAQRFGDRAAFVTFHQSFAYEDFVEGLKPYSDEEGRIRYEVRPGIFRQICTRAREDPDRDYLLVIDEINRANISSVLGELITLLEDDKRLGEASEIQLTLPYSATPFGVPQNLYILGTMNTADRSIALLDIALRRRFTFVEVMPSPEPLDEVAEVPLGALLEVLNRRIAALLDRDHQLGHSYFMHLSSVAELRFAWDHRIVPLLQEYFYNDGERLQAVLGEQFVERLTPDSGTQEALGEWYDPDAPRYRLARLNDEAFVSALRELAGNGV